MIPCDDRHDLGVSSDWYVPTSKPVIASTLTRNTQDAGLKYLHYVDSAVKFPVRKGLEDLPERIEIAMISEVATGTCAPFPHIQRDQTDIPLGASSPMLASPLSFSLLSTTGGSLADQIAPDQARWADWTDGLNMLRRDGGHVASQETELFVQALTEIGLKIKLLGTSLTPSSIDLGAHAAASCRPLWGESGHPERPRGWPAAGEQRFLLLRPGVRRAGVIMMTGRTISVSLCGSVWVCSAGFVA